MPMAICGLFFGLVISSNFRIRIFPPEASQKNPGNIHFFVKVSGTPPPKKNTRIFETMGKNPTCIHPTWRKKNMHPTCIFANRSCRGNFWLTTRELKSPTEKKILHQQSTFTFFPPKEPPPAWVRWRVLLPLDPDLTMGEAGCGRGFLFRIILLPMNHEILISKKVTTHP